MRIAEGLLEVRWHRRSDLPQLCKLFEQCFPDENWGGRDFLDFISKTNDRGTNTLKILGGEKTDKVYGAVLYTINGVCHIRRVAVLPKDEYRRHGLGTFLMNAALIGKRCPLRCEHFMAKVREDNMIGHEFLKSLGFLFDPKVAREHYAEDRDWYVFNYHKPVNHRLLLPMTG
jgi:ribosomal protein S18 acetylase RimI-like enzyme